MKFLQVMSQFTMKSRLATRDLRAEAEHQHLRGKLNHLPNSQRTIHSLVLKRSAHIRGFGFVYEKELRNTIQYNSICMVE